MNFLTSIINIEIKNGNAIKYQYDLELKKVLIYMSFLIRKLFLAAIFNSCLFLLLIIGIQNSSNKRKINLFKKDTVALPISFIVGVSFITGSITGSFVPFFFDKKKVDS